MKEKKKLIFACLAILLLIAVSIILFGWIGIWYDLIVAAIVGIALTGMKKHGLLKILMMLLLLIVIASFTLKGRQSDFSYIGIADVLTNYYSVILQNFSYIVLFILTVGGFYGVLNKTPAYKKLLDGIVTKVRPLNKKFIYIIIILFAIITSLTGMTLPLFIFIPFVVSIILLLGYDKLVAMSSTVVSICIGYMGGILVNFINPSTYGISTYEEFVGLDSKLANIFPKLLLLFIGIALLIFFVNRHIKSVEDKKVKYELSDNSDLLITEVKGNYKEMKVWPLIIVLSLMFVILAIGIIPWKELFNVTIFTDIHEKIMNLSIKNFKVFGNLISSYLPALGEWNSSGNIMAAYVYISLLIVFATLVIALIHRIKFNDLIDNFVEGTKKVLPIAAMITVAYTVLVCAYNNGFLELIIATYGKFNYGISSLLAFVGCILNVDTIWVLVSTYGPIVNLISDETVYESVAILLQGIYGIFSFVGPTSLILIVGLTYLDIPYTTWLKYIWRFILAIIVTLALITLLVTLI